MEVTLALTTVIGVPFGPVFSPDGKPKVGTSHHVNVAAPGLSENILHFFAV